MADKYEWFDKVLTLSGTHLPSIKSDVNALIDEFDLKMGGDKPQKYLSYTVSGNLMKKAAYKAAGIGGLTTLPMTIPIIGTIGTVLAGSLVDLALVLRIQIELCFAISAAYGVELGEDELKAITLALLGFSGSSQAFKATAASVLRTAVDEIAKSYINRGVEVATVEFAERLIPRLLKKYYRFIPFIGVPLGASFNLVSTMTVGNHARKYFSVWDNDNIQISWKDDK
ncbi:MAG: EcsC family protein [Nitrospirae bacterium]|nr:EcsC family protein [Nitrospirota bacterium]MBF0534371.1 EcsC family protein [Nitrospirota bacterium]MBF0615648.1 EcsC family protein [Nitrospirota bacterium]